MCLLLKMDLFKIIQSELLLLGIIGVLGFVLFILIWIYAKWNFVLVLKEKFSGLIEGMTSIIKMKNKFKTTLWVLFFFLKVNSYSQQNYELYFDNNTSYIEIANYSFNVMARCINDTYTAFYESQGIQFLSYRYRITIWG